MEKYCVYANLDKVAAFLIKNGHDFQFETDYPKPRIAFFANAEFVEDIKECLSMEHVYPVFCN